MCVGRTTAHKADPACLTHKVANSDGSKCIAIAVHSTRNSNDLTALYRGAWEHPLGSSRHRPLPPPPLPRSQCHQEMPRRVDHRIDCIGSIVVGRVVVRDRRRRHGWVTFCLCLMAVQTRPRKPRQARQDTWPRKPRQGQTSARKAAQAETRPDKARQGQTRPDKARQGRARPDKAAQGQTSTIFHTRKSVVSYVRHLLRGICTGCGARPDKARQGQTRPDKAAQGQTRPRKARQARFFIRGSQ